MIKVLTLPALAAGLILFHNHPSGDPTPSKEDLALTRRLKQAGRLRRHRFSKNLAGVDEASGRAGDAGGLRARSQTELGVV